MEEEKEGQVKAKSKSGGTGKHLKALESTGRHREAMGGTGWHKAAPEGTGRKTKKTSTNSQLVGKRTKPPLQPVGRKTIKASATASWEENVRSLRYSQSWEAPGGTGRQWEATNETSPTASWEENKASATARWEENEQSLRYSQLGGK